MLTLGVVGAFSKFVVSVMNRATCSNYDTLRRHMTERPRPRGLITVSNHSSTFDDPGVLSYLIPASYFATEPSHNGVRWTICTREICASSPLVHMFFTAGKTVPIDRGGGLNQRVLETMAERLARGDWLHVFPEGRVNREPWALARLKWGLGKMLCDVDRLGGEAPVVIPFWHSGMERVKRYGTWGFFPFNHVHVTVGDRIDFTDLTAKCGRCRDDKQREALYKEMVARVEEKMRETRDKNKTERETA